MKVSGVVDRLFSKDWPGKNGRPGNTSHSFKLKGNDTFYRLGYNKPEFRETDKVEFTVDDKGYVADLVVIKANPQQVASSAQADAVLSDQKATGRGAGNAGGAGTRDSYWNDKAVRDVEVTEPRISYAAARHDAVVLVGLALQHDLLSFGNANKSAKLGLLQDYVDQVTLRFARDGLNAPDIINGVERDVPEAGDGEKKNNDEGDLG